MSTVIRFSEEELRRECQKFVGPDWWPWPGTEVRDGLTGRHGIVEQRGITPIGDGVQERDMALVKWGIGRRAWVSVDRLEGMKQTGISTPEDSAALSSVDENLLASRSRHLAQE